MREGRGEGGVYPPALTTLPDPQCRCRGSVQANDAAIEAHNAQVAKGNGLSFTQGHNLFSGLTKEEWLGLVRWRHSQVPPTSLTRGLPPGVSTSPTQYYGRCYHRAALSSHLAPYLILKHTVIQSIHGTRLRICTKPRNTTLRENEVTALLQ